MMMMEHLIATEADENYPRSFLEQLTPGFILSNSIYFSNQPKSKEFILPPFHQGKRDINLFIINYSDLYQELVENAPDKIDKFIDPRDIATGDTLQAGSYRGCGSYYAIWLYRGLFKNDFLIDYEALEKKPYFQTGFTKADGDEDANLEKYQLDDDLLKNVQNICRMKMAVRVTELQNLLTEKSPQLLLDLTIGKSRRLLMEEILLHRFQGDGNSLNTKPGSPQWIGLQLADFFDEYYEKSPDAKFLLSKFPSTKYPILKSRSQLRDFYCSAEATRNTYDLYVFRHTDENGYTIPTAMSMAPVNYFASTIQSRDIDLTLLPFPLSEQSALGFALNNIKRQIIPLLIEEEQQKNDDNNNRNGIEDKPKKKKQKIEKKGFPSSDDFAANDIVVIDFQVHDAIHWMNISNADQMMVIDSIEESPLITTRKIFEQHVKGIKKNALRCRAATNPAVADEEVFSFFKNLSRIE